MAESKYLDGGGLQRAWDRIKAYLTTWKTTNFGSGTYQNFGIINIPKNHILNLTQGQIEFTDTYGTITLQSLYGIGSCSCRPVGTSVVNATSKRLRVTTIRGENITSFMVAAGETKSDIVGTVREPIIFVWGQFPTP